MERATPNSMSQFRTRSQLSREDRAKLRRAQKRLERIRMVKSCCKNFFAFFLSHLGLSALVFSYVFLGGIVFQGLEAQNEVDKKQIVASIRNHTLSKLIHHLKNCEDEIYAMQIDEVLLEYTDEIVEAIKTLGWNGKYEPHELSWSFEGSILFAVTVITTIGYGHAAPKTASGRFVTMIYALLGIPLTFLFLSNLGDYMAKLFKVLYSKVCISLGYSPLHKANISKAPLTTISRNATVSSLSNRHSRWAQHQSVSSLSVKAYRAGIGSMNTSSKLHIFRSKPPTSQTMTTFSANSRPNSQLGNTLVNNKSFTLTNLNQIVSNPPTQSNVSCSNEKTNQVVVSTPNNIFCNSTGNPFSQMSERRKFYCQAIYLPSRIRQHQFQKESAGRFRRSRSKELRDEAHANDMSQETKDPSDTFNEIPLVNWRDIESELEIISIRNELSSPHNYSFHTAHHNDSLHDIPEYLSSTDSEGSPPLVSFTPTKALEKQISPHPPETPSWQRMYSCSVLDTVHRERSRVIPSRDVRNTYDEIKSPASQHVQSEPNLLKDSPRRYQQGNWQVSPSPFHLRPLLPRKFSLDDAGIFGTPVEKHRRVSYSSDGRDLYKSSPSLTSDWTASSCLDGLSMKRTAGAIRLQEVTVPLSLSILVLAIYIILGAIVFIIWEDADFLKWAYFCFITLSTIGFGDIIPGTKIDADNPKEKMICLLFYVVMGLALMAMCFKLMQEEVIAKVKRLGRRLIKLRKRLTSTSAEKTS